jgi:O-antigen/teichoic acid export membrane protein
LPTIRVFFGPQWDAAAPIATFMAIWLILRSTHGLANKLFVATGNEKITMIKELVLLILAVTFVIGAFPFGLNAIASSFVLLGIIELVLVSWLLKRFLALDYITFYKQLFPNVLISVICGLTTWGISFFISFESEPAWKPVLAIFFCLPVTWLGFLFLFKHPLASELGNLTR